MLNRSKQASTSGGLIKTSVQLAPEQLEEIDHIAEERGVSRSAVVSELTALGLPVYRQQRRLIEALDPQKVVATA